MVARLGWRIINPVPSLPDSTMNSWQQKLAHANHWLLYLMLIGLPLGGYMMVSLYGQPVPFFGAELPPILPENQELAGKVKTMHSLGAALIVVLVALHIAAALRHGYVLKDGVLQRMAPFMK
jgi:cytochrome b561